MSEDPVGVTSEVVSNMERRCNLCGGSRQKMLFVKNSAPIVKCLDCGLVFAGREYPWSELAGHYGRGFFESQRYSQTDRESDIRERELKFLEEISLIERYVRPGKLLDVGSGWGLFLKAARERGWEVQGVEISEHASRVARESLGLDVRNLELTKAGLPTEHFDLVTMWDVLEHLDDPLGYLREAHRVLKKDGLLVVETLDAESFEARIRGASWDLYDPPSHLTYFTRRTLKAMLVRAGFRPFRLSTRGNLYPWAPLAHPIARRIVSLLRLGSVPVVYCRKGGSEGPGQAGRG